MQKSKNEYVYELAVEKDKFYNNIPKSVAQDILVKNGMLDKGLAAFLLRAV